MQVFCAHLAELVVALLGEGDELGFVAFVVGVFGFLLGADQTAPGVVGVGFVDRGAALVRPKGLSLSRPVIGMAQMRMFAEEQFSGKVVLIPGDVMALEVIVCLGLDFAAVCVVEGDGPKLSIVPAFRFIEFTNIIIFIKNE